MVLGGRVGGGGAGGVEGEGCWRSGGSRGPGAAAAATAAAPGSSIELVPSSTRGLGHAPPSSTLAVHAVPAVQAVQTAPAAPARPATLGDSLPNRSSGRDAAAENAADVRVPAGAAAAAMRLGCAGLERVGGSTSRREEEELCAELLGGEVGVCRTALCVLIAFTMLLYL